MADKKEIVLDGGEDCQIKLLVKSDELGGAYFQEGIVALCDEEGEIAKEVKVEAWPWPEEVVFSPFELVRGRIPEKPVLSVQVWPAPLRVRSIAFDPPYLKTPDDLFLDLGDASIPITVHLPEGLGPGTYSLSYQLSTWGLQGGLRGELQLHLIEPAKLSIKEGGSLEVMLILDDEESLSLTIKNEGGELLEVNRIEVIPVRPGSEMAISICVDGVQFPLKLPAGRESTLGLRISSTSSVHPGDYAFQLRFHSNSLLEYLASVYVSVSDEEYPGLIAVDYGTTDSAVACLATQRERGPLSPMNLSLEGGGQGDKIYSNIYFKAYEPDKEIPFVWCIGTEAKKLGQSPGNRRRLVKAIKTKIGKDKNHVEQIDIEGARFELSAEEIVKFIQMDLLKRTRKALKQRPISILLSIPTRFTLRQKSMLRDAFAQALQATGLEATVEAVDESLAAGMFYIVIRGPREELLRAKDHYTLMVIDFGGGTTDVTLFQVEQKLGKSGTVEGIEQVEIF